MHDEVHHAGAEDKFCGRFTSHVLQQSFRRREDRSGWSGLRRGNLADGGEESGIQCPSIVHKHPNNFFDARSPCRRYGWGSVLLSWFLQGGAGAGLVVDGVVHRLVWGQVEALESIGQESWHAQGGGAERGAAAFPEGNVESNVGIPCPVGFDFIQLLQRGKHVFGVGFSFVLHAEVIDDQCKCYTVALVFEQARRVLALVVPMLCQVLDKALLCK